MIVGPNRAQPELTFVLLNERELMQLLELLANPKKRVSDDAKSFALSLKTAVEREGARGL